MVERKTVGMSFKNYIQQGQEASINQTDATLHHAMLSHANQVNKREEGLSEKGIPQRRGDPSCGCGRTLRT